MSHFDRPPVPYARRAPDGRYEYGEIRITEDSATPKRSYVKFGVADTLAAAMSAAGMEPIKETA